ncbi:hypothetical protein A2886_03090 [candidate division WWE3 bacterium RIFCSPHIGHO2_01_FULL_42_13]|uniref:Glycosyl transferase family 1 domain-containing protein n=1 Tax=candidate division WWE3 bacterium RIFCSPHIGHO2_01_FULL_42_13 TaxID=1802617 RepID=A0A1F4UQ20_UNCKA|nr:MAG: hypothetical protein A2886_03090 [candidate division WWE3 bacterium RIFCSPHIGHO2_01_FULL_42_13]HLB66338.1 glycosyltransferase [Candidatus Saccharimonadales bacterium]
MTKRLLFIAHTDNLKGGGELSLVELIKSAKKRGYQPYAVAPGPGEFTEKLKQAGVSCTPVRYYYWGRPYSVPENTANLLAIKKISELVDELKIDCVVTNTLMIPWGALAASIANIPHIWITREFLTHHHGHLHNNYDFIGAYSNMVFANSRDNVDYLQKEIGMKNARQFYSYVDVVNLRLNKRQIKPRVIYIAARIHPDKDQLELAKALSILEKHYRLKIEAVFIGSYSEDDEYFQKLKSFIRQNNLGKRIKFTGFKPKPFELVGPNDIFVRSSKHESLGRAITEAMKLGLICVAADIESSKEAFRLGGGVLYKSGNPKGLANVLRRIIKNPQDFRELALQAKAKSLSNLSEENCHKPFFEGLEKVFGQKNPRRELQYIYPQFANIIKTLEGREALAAHYKSLAERRRQAIEDITNSKGWRAVLFVRRVLRR